MIKQNSLVVYIGGQCETGKRLCPLSKDVVYTVSDSCNFFIGGKIGPECIYLDELMHITGEGGKPYAFLSTMFKVVDQPRTVDIEEVMCLIKEQ